MNKALPPIGRKKDAGAPLERDANESRPNRRLARNPVLFTAINGAAKFKSRHM
jgi:hypothetical protein